MGEVGFVTFLICFRCGTPSPAPLLDRLTRSSYSSMLAIRIEQFCFQRTILHFRRYLNWTMQWTLSSRWTWCCSVFIVCLCRNGYFFQLRDASSTCEVAVVDTYLPHGGVGSMPSLRSVRWVNKWTRVTAKGWDFLQGWAVIVAWLFLNKRLRRGALSLSSSRGPEPVKIMSSSG